MRKHRFFLPALLVSLTMACTPEATVMPAATRATKLDGTAWVLASLPGRSLVAGRSATLRFEGDRAQGSDGCNRYSTGFRQLESSLEFSSAGVATQMACPEEISNQAAALHSALGDTRSFQLVNGLLELLATDGHALATFRSQATALSGTTWNATAINNGKQAVVSLAGESSITIEFFADGKVTGSTGCNRYNASYRQDGSRLEFGPAATTRMACASPDLAEQEQNFLKALQSVAAARFEGDGLELRDAADAMAIVARQTTAP